MAAVGLGAGVGVALWRGRGGRATDARALIELGRNNLLSSSIVLAIYFSEIFALAKAGLPGGSSVALVAAEGERKRSVNWKRPDAQPPIRDYNTAQTIVNSILLRLTLAPLGIWPICVGCDLFHEGLRCAS